MRRSDLPIILSVAIGILAGVPAVYAADGITLEPAVVRLTMKPGEIWRGVISVTNESDGSVTLTPTTANLSRSTEDDTIELSEDIATRLGTLASWLRPGSGSVTLGARQQQSLNFSIQVPENAPPGTHRGLLVLSPASLTPQGNTLSVTAAVAMGVDLTVVGQPNHHIRLDNVFISPRIGAKAPVAISGVIVNTGNTLPVVTMRADIGRLWGAPVSVVMKPENGSQKVAPGSQALYRGVWRGEGFVPVGIFRAHVFAEDSSGPYESSRYFILVPWQAVVGVFIAGAVILWGRRFGSRFLRRRRR